MSVTEIASIQKEIREELMEGIEIFVHGALCVSYSGQVVHEREGEEAKEEAEKAELDPVGRIPSDLLPVLLLRSMGRSLSQ